LFFHSLRAASREQARQELLAGKHRHDILETALNMVEDDTAINTIGSGGYPNLVGEIELDAAFMDGNNRMLGAIAATASILVALAIRRFAAPVFTLTVASVVVCAHIPAKCRCAPPQLAMP
jgi:isoaspartyl peptidase/L-asparaginase-like protein (Ntn-hydrolase superfamily)